MDYILTRKTGILMEEEEWVVWKHGTLAQRTGLGGHHHMASGCRRNTEVLPKVGLRVISMELGKTITSIGTSWT